MPRLANQSFSAPPSYERSAVDNRECSGRWRAEPAQGQDDPVEYSCHRLPRHTQKLVVVVGVMSESCEEV